MTDVRVHDQNFGDVIVGFDGRVVEVFTMREYSSARFHLAMLTVEISEPDRKDRIRLDLSPSRPGDGGIRMVVHRDDWWAIAPVLDEIQAAISARGPRFSGEPGAQQPGE